VYCKKIIYSRISHENSFIHWYITVDEFHEEIVHYLMYIKYSRALHNNASLIPVKISLTMQAFEKGFDWDHKINVK
jgi:hypothetical protein